MVKTEDKDIDGMHVAVTQFTARRGFLLQAKLLRIFGPVLSELFAGKDEDTKALEDKNIDMSMLGKAIEKLFNMIDEQSAMKLVFELLTETRIDNKEITESEFDMSFAGKYKTLFSIIAYVLEVNFGDFFGGGSIGSVVKKAIT